MSIHTNTLEHIQEIYSHFNIPEESTKVKMLSNIFLKNTLTRYRKQSDKMKEYCMKYTDFMIAMREKLHPHRSIFQDQPDVGEVGPF